MVEVKLIGWVDPVYARAIEMEGLSDVVELLPYVPHKESVRYLTSSSLLWLPAGEEEIPGKVYEYLGSKKPIIATAPEGSCARLIRRTRSGVVIDPTNTSEIVKALSAHYRLFVKGRPGLGEDKDLRRFNRVNQTEILASLFDEVTQ
jgi:glycosyltransferase involved in cell wall biosynthesis